MKLPINTRTWRLTCILWGGLVLGAAPSIMAQQTIPTGSPAPTRGPATSFSGTVWVTTLVGPNTETDCIVSSVAFDAKARTFWHTHPNGQLLVVTRGVGYYQEKGKPARVIREGESVTVPPMVEHWHGAGPGGSFTHIAINPNVSKGGAVNWLQAVTEEDYRAAH
ncbi:cupin 2 conserved barrel domain protein [Fibrella aestuarina BUZ 2]|uniref:Cupin 2 conserved barrel domain protein n=1 Tax=Fibrella aestuarina BUZ 2 TaxID=1166018 RepID=I0K8T5_9BACT|nr:cupin domain-containing protein [Fibrella aestuarina]CCH00538.1 cupin 2 conserved barrel domain protein [Fibrella aestuarina BUZ 2]